MRRSGGYTSSYGGHESPAISGDDESKISNDISSATAKDVLESAYQDKYNLMKSAYEKRIVQLSEVIQDTCMSICSDELLNSMKLDNTSSAFMPAHISEILNVHIDGERERYIHDMVQKTASLEVQSSQSNEKVIQMTAKIAKLEIKVDKGRKTQNSLDLLQEKMRLMEEQYNKLSSESQVDGRRLRSMIDELEKENHNHLGHIETINTQMRERIGECETLKSQNDTQLNDIRVLESQFEQSTRDLAAIEALDAKEQQIKIELQADVSQLKADKEALSTELADARNKIRFLDAEVIRLELSEREKEGFVAESKDKMAALMKQVEGMLQDEAEESNRTIGVVHAKMKDLRHKLFVEVTKEKRYSSSLVEELQSLRSYKDEKSRELRNAVDDEIVMREKYQREQQKALELTAQLSDAEILVKECRSRTMEAELKAKAAIETVKNMEDDGRAQSERDKRLDYLNIRDSTYRMHYQNEQLRHSYAGTSSLHPVSAANVQSGHQHHAHGAQPSEHSGHHSHHQSSHHHVESALKGAKDIWMQEKSVLETANAQYIVKIEQLQSELAMSHREHQSTQADHEETLQTQGRVHSSKLDTAQRQHAHEVKLLSHRLGEAERNVDKLRNMVGEKNKHTNALMSDIQDAHKVKEQADQEKDYHRQRHEYHKEQHEHHEGHHKHHKDRHEYYAKLYEDLHTEYRAVHQQKEGLESEVQRLTDELASASAAVSNMRQPAVQNGESTEDASALREEIEELREQLRLSKLAAIKFQEKFKNLEQEIEHTMKKATGHSSEVRKSFLGSGIFGQIDNLVQGLDDSSTSPSKIDDKVNRRETVTVTSTRRAHFAGGNDLEENMEKTVQLEDNVRMASDLQAREQEIERLTEELDKVKKQAMVDQSEDAAMLNDMRAKFENLTQLYENNVKVKENEHAQAQEAKDSEITSLQVKLGESIKVEGLEHEREETREHKKRRESIAEKLLSVTASQQELQEQLGNLKSELENTEKELDEVRLSKKDTEEELSKTKAKLQGLSESSKRVKDETLQEEMKRVRAEAVEKDIELERLKHLHERDMAMLKEKQAGSRSLNAFSPPAEPGSSNTDSLGNSNGNGMYESVCKGLLDALLEGQFINPGTALEVNNCARSHQKGDRHISNSLQAQGILARTLDAYKTDYQSALQKVMSEAEALRAQLNSSKGRPYDETISLDGDNSSRGGHMVVGELEQSKHEHALVVELTKLEGDSRVQTLLAQMNDLKKRHTVELDRQGGEHSTQMELLSVRHASAVELLEEQIRDLKQTVTSQQDSLSDSQANRTSTTETKLQLERNKRKELMRNFEEVEQSYRVTIEELETENLALEQRCEKAELLVTKLKMDLIAAAGVTRKQDPEDLEKSSLRDKDKSRDKERRREKEGAPAPKTSSRSPVRAHYMTTVSEDFDGEGHHKVGEHFDHIVKSHYPRTGRSGKDKSSAIEKERSSYGKSSRNKK